MRLSILTVLTFAAGCGAPVAEPTKSGFISVSESPGYLHVQANFVEAPPPARCETSTIAGCKVTDCTFSPNLQSVPLPTDRAGTITAAGMLADGGVGTASTMTPDPFEAAKLEWAEGTTLTVSATGGAVPAFSGVSVKMPRPTALTSPQCPPLACSEPLRANTPMAIAWTGEPEATVVAQLTTSATVRADLNRFLSVECVLPASPAAVPVEVLHLVADARGPGGFAVLSVKSFNRTAFVAGEYAMQLEASRWAGTFMFRN